MQILLDTHVFLWCVNDDKRLSKKTRQLIRDATLVYVSSASIWEMTIKTKLRKLDVNIPDLVTSITESGFQELPILSTHVAKTYNLPTLHNDPFDRMLIAQAISEPLRLLTADKALKGYTDLIELI